MTEHGAEGREACLLDQGELPVEDLRRHGAPRRHRGADEAIIGWSGVRAPDRHTRNWLLKPFGGLPTHTRLRSSQRSKLAFFEQHRL